MYLPELANVSKSRDMNIDFAGYNGNMYVKENQFADTLNLCATNYPVMTPRAARATVTTLQDAQGIYARRKLCWCAGGKFYYDGVEYGQVTAGEKQLVGMGSYILIFPDGKRFSTVTHAWEELAASYTATGTVTATLCRADGSDYGSVTASDTAPTGAASGSYWLDTSGETHVLKLKSGSSWVSIMTTYIRIEAAGIGAGFRAGDVVEIAGAADETLNGSRSVTAATENSLTVVGLLDEVMTQTGGLTVTRSVPQMDFVCELNNRIWGCSSENHEIYACKLGDPTNWRAYEGLASDSYAATVGSEGDFTACCAYGGYVLFFKEDTLHKLMGDKPANYQLQDKPIRGVAKGSEKSLAVVNEVLMYHSREGVVQYDGGGTMDVSDALGPGLFTNAAAGVNGDRYYISMQDEADEWRLFTFDETKGLWFREDETRAVQFAALNGQLYFLRQDGAVLAVRGFQEPGAELEAPFDWYAETGDMLIELPDNKYISRLQLRIGVEKGAKLKLEIQYDSSGEWEKIMEKGYTKKMSFTAPIIPMRCDHMRLRISGHGRSCVYAISKEVERGSEL